MFYLVEATLISVCVIDRCSKMTEYPIALGELGLFVGVFRSEWFGLFSHTLYRIF